MLTADEEPQKLLLYRVLAGPLDSRSSKPLKKFRFRKVFPEARYTVAEAAFCDGPSGPPTNVAILF